MITAYFVVGIILLLLWLGVTIAAVGTAINDEDKELFVVTAGLSALALFLIVIWPLVIPLALGVFLLYGLFKIPAAIRIIKEGI